jgi:hypothetical protein
MIKPHSVKSPGGKTLCLKPDCLTYVTELEESEAKYQEFVKQQKALGNPEYC